MDNKEYKQEDSKYKIGDIIKTNKIYLKEESIPESYREQIKIGIITQSINVFGSPLYEVILSGIDNKYIYLIDTDIDCVMYRLDTPTPLKNF